MNGKQHTVMVLGLSLVFLRFFTTGQFQSLWAVLIQGGAITGPAKIPGSVTTPSTPGVSPTPGTVTPPNIISI